jgi:hypothetical protein
MSGGLYTQTIQTLSPINFHLHPTKKINTAENDLRLIFMVFNATFNNISVISWQSVSLVEVTGENHRTVTSH